MTQYSIGIWHQLQLYIVILRPDYYEKNDMLQNIFIRTESLLVAKSHDLLTYSSLILK